MISKINRNIRDGLYSSKVFPGVIEYAVFNFF